MIQFCVLLHEDLTPRGCLLHIPAIDRILSTILQPPPPPTANLKVNSIPRPPAKERHGPVIDITSMSTACGKTHLLYYIAALCTLPSHRHSVPLRGKNSTVVIFDNDGRFDLCRLYCIMRSHILGCHEDKGFNISELDADAMANTALQHVHIYRPQSSRSMIEMLKGLPEYLLQPDGHHSIQRCLAAILIDGLSAFYWQDKLTGPKTKAPGYQQTYDKIVQHLREVSARFGAFIVATNWGLQLVENTMQLAGGVATVPSNTTTSFGTTNGEEIWVPAFRSHLPSAWTKFVDLKLVVERDTVVSFRRGISIVEALTENDAREKAGGNGGFTGWVDMRGLNIGAQQSIPNRDRTFRFRIELDGISFAN